MSDTLLQRLEAVAHRLESYAQKLGTAATHLGSSSAGATEQSAASRDWAQLETEHLTPFVNAANSLEATKSMGAQAKTAFDHVGTVIAASAVSKKPSDQELISFLKPISDAIEASGKVDPKTPVPNHAKAFNEGLTSVTWVTVSPPNGLPKDIAQNGVESADFYLIKILKDGKTKGGTEGDAYVQFAQTWKALLQAQVRFVVEHYRMGLEWNPKGEALSSYKATGRTAADALTPIAGAAAPPPPGPPDAPPPPPPSGSSTTAAPAAAGLGAVFGELTSINVTAGLKKVTNDMKTKNMKDKPVLEAPKKVTASAPSTGAAVINNTAAATTKRKAEPKKYLSKGTWFVENYESGEVILDEVELKENVYIIKCKNTTIKIPNKCKSIQVDNCTKTEVEFKNIVSIFEIFNSQRVAIYCTEACPSVAIDKSAGCSVHLNREAVKAPPQLITSSITELNFVVPGKTDDDDPIEIPVPEQYSTTYVNGKLVTEAVSHSGG